MSAHIGSLRDAPFIPRLSKDEFWQQVRPGDLIFCNGTAAISQVIERETNSPWSHVLMAWLPGEWDPTNPAPWLTLEATIDKGVHVGLLKDYVDSYDGDIVIARRPALNQRMIEASLRAGLLLVDWGYDWRQEVSIACRKLCDALPLIKPKKELYCSGLQWVMSQATPYPLQKPKANYPTPEDNWTDPSVVPVGVLDRMGIAGQR